MQKWGIEVDLDEFDEENNLKEELCKVFICIKHYCAKDFSLVIY